MENKRTVNFTTSMVKCFKQCRKKYQFEYIEQIKPIQTPAALKRGTLYHLGLEMLLAGAKLEDIKAALIQREMANSEEYGLEFDPIPAGLAYLMVEAFYRESGYTSWKIHAIEKKFEVSTGYAKRLVGKIDALVEKDGNYFLIEHKSTTRWDGDGAEYLHNLLWDEQPTNYLYAIRRMQEDGTISCPEIKGVFYVITEVPRIKKYEATPMEKRRYKRDGSLYANQHEFDETPEEYLERCAAWYADAPRVHTHFEYRTAKEIEEQIADLNLTFCDIVEAEKNGTFYRNPANCSIIECPYRPKCLENNPDTDVLFVRKTTRNEELNA
jgi:hypothetical protein